MRVSRAGGRGSAVRPVPAAAGCGVVRSARAGRPGRRARSGNAGSGGDSAEGERLAAGVQAAQGGGGPAPGVVGAAARGSDDVARVVARTGGLFSLSAVMVSSSLIMRSRFAATCSFISVTRVWPFPWRW